MLLEPVEHHLEDEVEEHAAAEGPRPAGRLEQVGRAVREAVRAGQDGARRPMMSAMASGRRDTVGAPGANLMRPIDEVGQGHRHGDV